VVGIWGRTDEPGARGAPLAGELAAIIVVCNLCRIGMVNFVLRQNFTAINLIALKNNGPIFDKI